MIKILINILQMDDIASKDMTASDLLVDSSNISRVIERYTELLTDLSMADIKVEGLPFTKEGEITRLLEQLINFPTQLGENYDMTDPLA